jgi:ABC-type phosphate transport system ATPase subunit
LLVEKKGKIAIQDFYFYYGSFMALKDLNLSIQPNQIFAILGDDVLVLRIGHRREVYR